MIDLHTHSNASDGASSPTELYAEAAALGLTAIALADHDTTGGLAEFLAAARPGGPVAVPGVEVSVANADREVHIVGLFIRLGCDELEGLLREIRVNRDARNHKIIERLQQMGYGITLAEVRALAGGDSIGRPLFAQVLIGKGYFHEPQEVFDRCLKRGAPAYVPRVLPDPAAAIAAIHAADGLAIWAHALHRSRHEAAAFRQELDKLVDLGLDGIETLYSTFTPSQTALLTTIARERGLAVSGGTDYHGANQPSIRLGSGQGDMAIPDDIYLALLDKHRAATTRPIP
jgi:hypothetical protein